MQTYIGTKTIFAVLMTLGEYNTKRGWTQPPDEDPHAEGYLIEYTDGGKPNHPDHSGYISWSPKDVFEKAYRPAGTAKQRVELEFKDLCERIDKLDAFMHSPTFDAMEVAPRELLKTQRVYMAGYRGILNSRLNSWQEI